MKTELLISAMCVCLLSCNRGEMLTTLSKYTDGDPMSPSFDWSGIPSQQLEDSVRSDNSVILQSVWDSDSLYFRFEVSDTRLWGVTKNNDDPDLWKDDIVEFLIDARNDHVPGWRTDDLIYHYNILGFIKDDRGAQDGTSDCGWNSAGRYIVNPRGTICDNSDIDEGYSVLASLPWAEIGRDPECGLCMGFTFGCCDNDGVPVSIKPLFNWSGADPTRSPEQFGILKLIK